MQESIATKKTDWFSILQAGFSFMGAILLWGLALMILFVTLINILGNGGDESLYGGFLLLSAGLTACGFLLLPSAVYALAQVVHFRLPSLSFEMIKRWMPWVILAFPFVLSIGHWLSNQSIYGVIFLAPFHILALGIPILCMIYLGLRHLPSSSNQRRWGLFSVGLTLSPVVILVIEFFVMIILIFVAAIWLATEPQLLDELNRFTEEFNNGIMSTEEIYSKILPFISHPSIFAITVAFTSLIVPIIEEAIKPLGIWFLIKRKLTPSEGFVGGLLCGAGYGMLENIMLAYSRQDWIATVTARMGTSFIHMATSSLVGWALVIAIKEKKLWQLAAAYILAVFIHGLWNGLAVTQAFATLLETNAPVAIQRLGLVASPGLCVLALCAFLFIVLSNRRLQMQSAGFSDKAVNPSV